LGILSDPSRSGVHDKALPAHCGAGFFEVNAHHDEDLLLHFFGQSGEFFGVGTAGLSVVDGAGANDEKES
jgi:hypothetical protein